MLRVEFVISINCSAYLLRNPFSLACINKNTLKANLLLAKRDF